MTELVRQWLLGVACTALILAVADSLAPEGSVKKICRLAGGLALMLAAVSPLLRLDSGALADMLKEYQAAVRSYEETLEEQYHVFYQTVIEGSAAAYIVDKAKEMGISCQAEVTFLYDEDGVPCPWEVTAWGDWTDGTREELERLLEDDLGVPPQRQHYEERLP